MYSLPAQEVSSTSSREDVFCIMAGVRSNYADVKPQDSMTTVTSNYIIDFCITCDI